MLVCLYVYLYMCICLYTEKGEIFTGLNFCAGIPHKFFHEYKCLSVIVLNNEHLWPRECESISLKTSMALKLQIFSPANLSPSMVHILWLLSSIPSAADYFAIIYSANSSLVTLAIGILKLGNGLFQHAGNIFQKQVDILISKNQVLQILYLKHCVYKQHNLNYHG